MFVSAGLKLDTDNLDDFLRKRTPIPARLLPDPVMRQHKPGTSDTVKY